MCVLLALRVEQVTAQIHTAGRTRAQVGWEAVRNLGEDLEVAGALGLQLRLHQALFAPPRVSAAPRAQT